MSSTAQPHPHRFTVRAIGVPVEVEIRGRAGEAAAARFAAAWDELLCDNTTLASKTESAPIHLDASDAEGIAQLLDQASRQVTIAAIGARAGELLMLHAAGLSAPISGRVLACVGPSGTGKTTLAAAAAGVLDYVTDETVGVAPSGSVVRYPKPLSVIDTPGLPKSQLAPRSYGLALAPEEGLMLGGVVLLDRSAAATHMDVEGSRAELDAVDLLDAITALVPETSYLTRFDAPLQFYAETILRSGGALRLRYVRADDAIECLATTHPAFAVGSEGWREGDLPELESSQAVVRQWREAIADVRDGATPSGDVPAYRLTAPLQDLFVGVETGRALVCVNGQIALVSIVAAAFLLAVEAEVSGAQLHVVLETLFGRPPGPMESHVREMARALAEVGVLAT